LPLAARDNNTQCAHPLHTMAGKRNLYPFGSWHKISFHQLLLLYILGSSNAPATTFLQIAICHNRIADALLLQIALCRHNQIADALVMKSKRGKRPYEMKPLWHNGVEVSALQEWEGSLQESFQGVCHTMALPWTFLAFFFFVG
jgi:hypothetical protein